MAKYLVQKGWDVTVLTTPFQTKAGCAAMGDCDGIRVECIPSFPITLIERVSRFPKIRNLLFLLSQGLFFPDSFAPWIRKVARRLRNMEYDAGILNVLPYSAFALEKHGILDSRWIIDYQESVYPLFERRTRRSPLQKWLTPKLLDMEKSALFSCGGAWFTSNASRNRYISDLFISEEKTAYLPHYYDPDMYPDSAENFSGDGVTILYGGKLGISWRSPETFFRAWKEFLNRCPDAVGKTRMVLYGNMDKACENLADELGVLKLIDRRKPISYSAFLAETKKADLLLYIDARDQELFNPGKLADYFGASKPIMAFTSPGSDVEGMLKNAGMERFISAPNDVEKGARNLAAFWECWKRGDDFPLSTEQYSVSTVCGKAAGFLEKMCENIAGKKTVENA